MRCTPARRGGGGPPDAAEREHRPQLHQVALPEVRARSRPRLMAKFLEGIDV
ncbi:MAG: hypothetical protein AVDCRST_MAG64-1326 [uncultured Phycisphaerae bacterium]|uniref:Uncharacterized protein n=1 Tax=uncultured Phycisphaerae bacterium TaxID=904963 RepID=A0A6J4NPZ6_9BACT|nr:MAG: hypothetical protein AVDCRST_MAG64-1326 [uncultured Phycisphaerae bacterium]